VDDQLVATRILSGRGTDQRFAIEADDTVLCADGADATRLVMRVTDEHGNERPFATGVLQLTVDGPVSVVGDKPIALVGGVAAVWLRAGEEPGVATVTALHPRLGDRTVRIRVDKTTGEPW
jgi:beta-galactosidase